MAGRGGGRARVGAPRQTCPDMWARVHVLPRHLRAEPVQNEPMEHRDGRCWIKSFGGVGAASSLLFGCVWLCSSHPPSYIMEPAKSERHRWSHEWVLKIREGRPCLT